MPPRTDYSDVTFKNDGRLKLLIIVGTRPEIIRLFTALGYRGFTLDHGGEIPLTPESTKDIIFRHAH